MGIAQDSSNPLAVIFMAFDICATVFCFFFVKETRGKALEVAAGTEWEVAEKNIDELSDNEKAEPHDAPAHAGPGGIVVSEAKGKVLEVVGAHDTFGSGLKHRS